MMKTLLSEIIRIELLTGVLKEGRVENAKLAYPEDTDDIDYFVRNDPSGNNKYLMWAMKMHKSDAPNRVVVADALKVFHDNVNKFPIKDINQYKTWDVFDKDLGDILSKIEQETSKRQEKKLEQNTKKLYESKDWLLVRPLSHESSCKYGAGTKWCTTEKDNPSYFNNYFEKNLLVYLIHKPTNVKFAVLYKPNDDGSYTIYNPLDEDVTTKKGWGSVTDFIKKLVGGKALNLLVSRLYVPSSAWIIDYGGETRDGMNESSMRTIIEDEILENIELEFKGRTGPKRISEILKIFGFGFEYNTVDYIYFLNKGRGDMIDFRVFNDEKDISFDQNYEDFDEFVEHGYEDFLKKFLTRACSWPELKDFYYRSKFTENNKIYVNYNKLNKIPKGTFLDMKELFGDKDKYAGILSKEEGKIISNVIKDNVNSYKKEYITKMKSFFDDVTLSRDLELLVKDCQDDENMGYCLDLNGGSNRSFLRKKIYRSRKAISLQTFADTLNISGYDVISLYLKIKGRIK